MNTLRYVILWLYFAVKSCHRTLQARSWWTVSAFYSSVPTPSTASHCMCLDLRGGSKSTRSVLYCTIGVTIEAEAGMTVYSKGKDKAEHLYSALHGIQTTLKCSGMDHTDLPAINTMPALPRKRSPDGASTDWSGEHLIATHYSFIDPKGWKAELADLQRK